MVSKYLVSRKQTPSPEILARFDPLDRLSATALQRAADAGAVEEMPPGKLIFKPGTSEDESLFLVAGEITLVSDDRVVDTVVAGTEAARGELGPERPRTLWGWTTTRVTLVRLERGLLRELSARSRSRRKGGTARGAAGRGTRQDLQARLAASEAARAEAEAEAGRLAAINDELSTRIASLEARLKETEASLAKARSELQDQADLARRPADAETARDRARAGGGRLAAELERAAAPASAEEEGRSRAAAPARGRRTAREPDVPALRVDPRERAALAPDEIDAFSLTPARSHRGEPSARRQRAGEPIET